LPLAKGNLQFVGFRVNHWSLVTGCGNNQYSMLNAEFPNEDRKIDRVRYWILFIQHWIFFERNNQYPMLNTEFPGKD
jgi:hypothetical protein